MNIIFMGTPDFAVPALKALIENKKHNVKAVFTREPKPQNRGMKLTNSPVHDLANSHNIKVFTPKTLKNNQAIELVDQVEADIIVVVAYGFIIPPNILNSKKYGCLNIHPSKLPKYRGAAPLQRTIINGESETAVCVMQMDEGLDTGDIILQEDFVIDSRISLQELHDKSANIGAKLLQDVLDNIEQFPQIKQSDEGITYADKLSKEEGKIDWNLSAYEIDCRVRGMIFWPGAYFFLDDKMIKIIESEPIDKNHNNTPGSIVSSQFEVVCGKGSLIIKKLKPEGKQVMSGADFLRGFGKNISEMIIVN